MVAVVAMLAMASCGGGGNSPKGVAEQFIKAVQQQDGKKMVGFENHSGKTWLGSGLEPLGKVLSGFGNNGEDGSEGAHYKNVFGTYSHGPLLPKNPELCDFILKTALERKYGSAELSPLDDGFELLAHDEMCAKL